MSETESPASVLRRAATLMRKRAKAATPGPWERPLDVRYKNFIGAALPEGEAPHSHKSGLIQDYGQTGYSGRYIGQRERVEVVSAPIDSLGSFTRGQFAPPPYKRKKSRSGADLEYIAAMDPLVGLAVADWLDDEAERAAGMDGYEDSDAYPMWLEGFSRPLAVALAYLGETPEVTG